MAHPTHTLSEERRAHITGYYTPADEASFREALRKLEQFINLLIGEGATSIELRELNIPDRYENPEEKRRQLRVIGYRVAPSLTHT